VAWPRPILVAAAIVVVISILGVIYFASTYALVTCSVCMTFKGRTECRTAAASSMDLAHDSAVRSACAALTVGLREAAACVQTAPSSSTCR